MAGWAISPTLCLPISLDGQVRPAGCAAGAGVFSFARKPRLSGPSNRLGRRSCPACRRRGPLIDPSATGFYRLAARAGGRTGLDRRSRRGSIETQPWHSSFKCGGGPFLRPPRAGLIATGTVDGPAVPGSCRSGRRVCWRSDRATPPITPSEAKTWPCTGRNSGLLRNRGCGDRIPAWDTVLCRDPAEPYRQGATDRGKFPEWWPCVFSGAGPLHGPSPVLEMSALRGGRGQRCRGRQASRDCRPEVRAVLRPLSRTVSIR